MEALCRRILGKSKNTTMKGRWGLQRKLPTKEQVRLRQARLNQTRNLNKNMTNRRTILPGKKAFAPVRPRNNNTRKNNYPPLPASPLPSLPASPVSSVGSLETGNTFSIPSLPSSRRGSMNSLKTGNNSLPNLPPSPTASINSRYTGNTLNSPRVSLPGNTTRRRRN